jgi:hypothetical protein
MINTSFIFIINKNKQIEDYIYNPLIRKSMVYSILSCLYNFNIVYWKKFIQNLSFFFPKKD